LNKAVSVATEQGEKSPRTNERTSLVPVFCHFHILPWPFGNLAL
jgi:hypothetical protein